MNNIVLIGFMGSGKSTIGAHLARRLGTFLLDTDNLIQITYNQTIMEFFNKCGEIQFRKQEHNLALWLSVNVRSAVIATGGGMPIYTNVKNMGKVFFLSICFDDIVLRLDSVELAKRPLFEDIKKARDIFNSRQELYKKNADCIINAAQEKEMVLKEILSHL